MAVQPPESWPRAPRPVRNEFHQVEIAGKTTTVRIPVWAHEVPMPERPDKRRM